MRTGKSGGEDCGKGQYERKPGMRTGKSGGEDSGKGQYERKSSMRTGKNRNKKMFEALHLVTPTKEDERNYPQYGGLVPYLVARIHGEDGARPLYADEDVPDGPIQITQIFATPDAGRVGPRAKFKIYWKEGGGCYVLARKGKGGRLSKLEGDYD